MKTIHKQILQITDLQSIHVPKGSEFLSVQLQNGNVCLWYRSDTEFNEQPLDFRHIAMTGTGQDCSHCDNMRFLGTIQLTGGSLVFHVFVE